VEGDKEDSSDNYESGNELWQQNKIARSIQNRGPAEMGSKAASLSWDALCSLNHFLRFYWGISVVRLAQQPPRLSAAGMDAGVGVHSHATDRTRKAHTAAAGFSRRTKEIA
jgi:hypothetical protein